MSPITDSHEPGCKCSINCPEEKNEPTPTRKEVKYECKGNTAMGTVNVRLEALARGVVALLGMKKKKGRMNV